MKRARPGAGGRGKDDKPDPLVVHNPRVQQGMAGR
jgi:hypothetical protein